VQGAAGKQEDVRKIHIAEIQDRQQRNDLRGWPIKIGYRLWDIFAGYGYHTGRLALALLIILLVAAGLGVVAAHIPIGPGRYVAMRTAQADNHHALCSLTEQIGVGIDRSLPVGTTGIRDRCDFDTTSLSGQIVTWITWGLKLLVWVLATFFLAGYVSRIPKAA
jgi:hypothetical protein